MPSDYERLPTTEPQSSPVDNRFNPPTPSTWKRVALIFFIIGLFIVAFRLRSQPAPPQIIHADRYSEKYKYRPAASPVITERLKDGRILLRGAFRGEL